MAGIVFALTSETDCRRERRCCCGRGFCNQSVTVRSVEHQACYLPVFAFFFFGVLRLEVSSAVRSMIQVSCVRK